VGKLIHRPVQVSTTDGTLFGDLVIPPEPRGLVMFAHGSGSSRHSPRNRAVARTLEKSGLATLLFDLLTADEEEIDRVTREYRFDIELLAARLVELTGWVKAQRELSFHPLGYFGASTGAAAALIAASRLDREVRAVVSRGGRPDLAMQVLPRVFAPTLLIVGQYDREVLELNRQAFDALAGEKELAIVPRTGHLFEEPGALELVGKASSHFFVRHLTPESGLEVEA
jgi:pimeloyl-ACP methyl ester carboxylesterase